MAMTCRCCKHPRRKELDRELAAGESKRTVATRYGLTESSVQRHREHVVKAVARVEVQRAASIAEEIHRLYEWAQRIGTQAEAEGDLRAVNGSIREMTRILELIQKAQSTQSQANPLSDPRWIALRDGLVLVLRPFPEAARAVNVWLASLGAPTAAPPLPPRGDSTESDGGTGDGA